MTQLCNWTQVPTHLNSDRKENRTVIPRGIGDTFIRLKAYFGVSSAAIVVKTINRSKC